MSESQYFHDARVHATLASVGFVVLLPVGILIARFGRAFTPKWFWPHAIWQFLIAGPVIMAGFAYGVKSVNVSDSGHLNDPHKKIGVSLFIMFIAQLLLGLTSHFVGPPRISLLLHRSPQRILHILLGLAIFALAFYQVHYGYTIEWPFYIGSIVPSSVPAAWKALVIIWPVLYVLGYALLPKQLSQESAYRNRAVAKN